MLGSECLFSFLTTVTLLPPIKLSNTEYVYREKLCEKATLRMKPYLYTVIIHSIIHKNEVVNCFDINESCRQNYKQRELNMLQTTVHTNTVSSPHLPSNIDRNADNHGRDSYTGYECNAHRGTYKRSQLPQNLLLPAPWLLTPESTA